MFYVFFNRRQRKICRTFGGAKLRKPSKIGATSKRRNPYKTCCFCCFFCWRKSCGFSIFCRSKGSKGGPPDARRMRPFDNWTQKKLIQPVGFCFFCKRKNLKKNTRTMKYVTFIVKAVGENLWDSVSFRCKNANNLIKPEVFEDFWKTRIYNNILPERKNVQKTFVLLYFSTLRGTPDNLSLQPQNAEILIKPAVFVVFSVEKNIEP